MHRVFEVLLPATSGPRVNFLLTGLKSYGLWPVNPTADTMNRTREYSFHLHGTNLFAEIL